MDKTSPPENPQKVKLNYCIPSLIYFLISYE